MPSIKDKLEKLVLLRTTGFCCRCQCDAYTDGDGERCPQCGSGNLMRRLTGHGVEYSCEPFYLAVLNSIGVHRCEFEYMNGDWYEELLNKRYGNVEICGQIFESGTAFRVLNPYSYGLARKDEVLQMELKGIIVEINGRYFYTDQLNEMITEAAMEAKVNHCV